MTTHISAAASNIDVVRIQEAVRAIIEAVGDDPEREGLQETPRRIADMYADIFSGLTVDARQIMQVSFAEEEHDEMVVLRDIPFYSMCEHHLLPFHGIAHVGYLPEGRLVGISKLARVVEIFARRLQLQEKMTSQIADALNEVLRPKGVAVVVEAAHQCMTTRGVHKSGVLMVTSRMLGEFRSNPSTRREFLNMIGTPAVRESV